MSVKEGAAPTTSDSLSELIGKGRPLPADASERLAALMGVNVGLEGLSRLFQPGFPGVRAFVIEARLAPDQTVEITIAGVDRSGKPVWTGMRAFVPGRDGSLEIHHGYDELDPDCRSRGITVDVIQRELDILALTSSGPAARITIDAEGAGRYVCALHGFGFADETEEGPSFRSVRALEPQGDRARLIDAAPIVIERVAARYGLGRLPAEEALTQLRAARTPWEIACTRLMGAPNEQSDGDAGALGIGGLGREYLLSREAPSWRATIYQKRLGDEPFVSGAKYRLRKTFQSETRLAAEIQAARDLLKSPTRALRMRALATLGSIAPSWVSQDIKVLADGPDRRIAALARATLRQVTSTDLPDRMLVFAENPAHDPGLRAVAYRVLAEYYPARLEGKVPMLRVNPDARVQRAVVPLIADDPTEAGPGLASMLAANPWHEGGEARAGLRALRLELIERLARLVDPRTLPVLLAAHRTPTPPSAPEMLALSRALVAYSDPRAQLALREAARRLATPSIP